MAKISSWQQAFDVLADRLAFELDNVPQNDDAMPVLIENLLSAVDSVRKDIDC